MKFNNTTDTSTRHPLIQWIDQPVRRAVRILNLQLARCSMTGQVAVFLLVVAALAFTNGTILWHALHEQKEKGIIIQSIPFSPMKVEESDSVLTQAEYTKLILFSRMLDSLQRTPGGKSIYNELMGSHPGLRDSINYLLKYYPPKK